MPTPFASNTTELQAVNEMLRTIGELPVSSVEAAVPLPTDADVALRTLRWVNREVQSLGWYFNTEDQYPIPMTPDGRLPVPANAMALDPDGAYQGVDAVIRGGFLYNRETHSFTFETGITCRVVFLLGFEELPEAARQYITIRAARRFQAGALGSQIINGYAETDEVAARLLMLAADAEAGDYNILTGSIDTFSIIDRRL